MLKALGGMKSVPPRRSGWVNSGQQLLSRQQEITPIEPRHSARLDDALGRPYVERRPTGTDKSGF